MQCVAAMLRTAISLACVAAISACATDSDEDDGRDDAIDLSGKADGQAFDITPGEMSEMMMIASMDRASVLHDQGGLSSRASAAIDAKATGPDGHRGSVDDTWFRTIPELDAVPYVGPITLRKLLELARTVSVQRIGPTSKAWLVKSAVATDIPRSNDPWDSTPAFTVDRTGNVVALYQISIHDEMLEIGGKQIPVPHDDSSVAYQKLAVAVDGSNTVHVFRLHWTNTAVFQHLTYANGTWSERELFDGSTLLLATNSDGAIVGLARGQHWEGSNYVGFAALHSFGAADSVEAWPASQPLGSTDPAALGIDAQGAPVVAYLHSATPQASTFESLRIMRRGASGYTAVQTPANAAWQHPMTLATTGGAAATVVMSGGDTSGGTKTFVVVENGATITAGPSVDASGIAFGIGPIYSVAADSHGGVHGCGNPPSTSSLNELDLGASTAAAVRLLNAEESDFCSVVTDAAGTVHMIYGNRRVYLHATHI
jgi:hypothetical protein